MQRPVTLKEYLDPVLVAETCSSLSLVQCEVQLFDEEVDELLVSRHLVVGQLVLNVGEGFCLLKLLNMAFMMVLQVEKWSPPEEAPQGVVQVDCCRGLTGRSMARPWSRFEF